VPAEILHHRDFVRGWKPTSGNKTRQKKRDTTAMPSGGTPNPRKTRRRDTSATRTGNEPNAAIAPKTGSRMLGKVLAHIASKIASTLPNRKKLGTTEAILRSGLPPKSPFRPKGRASRRIVETIKSGEIEAAADITATDHQQVIMNPPGLLTLHDLQKVHIAISQNSGAEGIKVLRSVRGRDDVIGKRKGKEADPLQPVPSHKAGNDRLQGKAALTSRRSRRPKTLKKLRRRRARSAFV
jgi:hypothetical protein